MKEGGLERGRSTLEDGQQQTGRGRSDLDERGGLERGSSALDERGGLPWMRREVCPGGWSVADWSLAVAAASFKLKTLLPSPNKRPDKLCSACHFSEQMQFQHMVLFHTF